MAQPAKKDGDGRRVLTCTGLRLLTCECRSKFGYLECDRTVGSQIQSSQSTTVNSPDKYVKYIINMAKCSIWSQNRIEIVSKLKKQNQPKTTDETDCCLDSEVRNRTCQVSLSSFIYLLWLLLLFTEKCCYSCDPSHLFLRLTRIPTKLCFCFNSELSSTLRRPRKTARSKQPWCSDCICAICLHPTFLLLHASLNHWKKYGKKNILKRHLTSHHRVLIIDPTLLVPQFQFAPPTPTSFQHAFTSWSTTCHMRDFNPWVT